MRALYAALRFRFGEKAFLSIWISTFRSKSGEKQECEVQIPCWAYTLRIVIPGGARNSYCADNLS